MAVKRREVGPIVVLSLKGSFFGDTETDELARALQQEVSAGNTRLVINMKDCQALNSIAIGVLMRAFASYKGREGEIKLCGLGQRIKSLFTMMKLIMVFDHYDTEEEALAAFAVA